MTKIDLSEQVIWVLPFTNSNNWTKGADIASATTTDIWAATWNFVDITWTTTITWFWTVQAWTKRTLQFDWVLILTYNATSLILPSNANITTVAWDTCEMISLWSGNWICTSYTREDWTALVSAWGGWASDEFSVYLAGSYSITSTLTTISFDTEYIDTDNNFNTGTYKYVVPTTWVYMFHFELIMTSLSLGDIIQVIAYYWASGVTVYRDIAWAPNLQMSGNFMVNATASDTVYIQIRNLTASRGTFTWWASWTYFNWYKLK